LGSALALAQFLTKGKKEHKHFCLNQPAPYFKFLPEIENLIVDYNLIKLKEHDLIIALDCGDIKRTGLADDLLKIKASTVLINIDHHLSNDYFGHYNLVVPQASSTSEILYNFFNFHNLIIDKYMATNLLAGILTDTMNFTNAATSTQSLKIASALLNQGARLNQIINNITQNKDLIALGLWGKLLSRLEYIAEYNFAYTIVTLRDLNENQIEPEAIDGLANFLSTLEAVDFILVLTEEKDNLIKGSLRTTGDKIDVSKLAQALGGGGHQKAAGFKLTKPLNTPDWKIFILSAIINKLRTLKSELRQP